MSPESRHPLASWGGKGGTETRYLTWISVCVWGLGPWDPGLPILLAEGAQRGSWGHLGLGSAPNMVVPQSEVGHDVEPGLARMPPAKPLTEPVAIKMIPEGFEGSAH